MEHTSKSPHVQMLMKGGSSSSHSSHPANVLMKGHSRQHHYEGGPSSPPRYAEGGKAEKRFATGGHCYAEGGEAEKEYGEKPLTGQLRRGGRAKRYEGGPSSPPRYAEGGSTEREEHRRGGQAKRREHHLMGMSAPRFSPEQVGKARDGLATIGKMYFPHHAEGGRAKHRKHHFAGEGVEGMSSQPQAGAPVGDNSVRQEQKKGGRTKRSHHYWGQDFFGRLPIIGGVANNLSRTWGTNDPDQYGGDNYTADTTGRKIADTAADIGNFLPSIAGLLGGGGKGAPAKKKGGGVHHKHRQHHMAGDEVFYKGYKPISLPIPKRFAEGGSGKVRKGMMTESGHMIHNDR